MLTFGFGRAAVLYDNTSARVVQRLGLQSESHRHQLRIDLYRLSGTDGPDPAFNRAILDLGRTVCRSDEPLCGSCPLASFCATATDRLPGRIIAIDAGRAREEQALPLAGLNVA